MTVTIRDEFSRSRVPVSQQLISRFGAHTEGCVLNILSYLGIERQRLLKRRGLSRLLASALGDKGGATATIVGLSAMMLLGFSALGTEAGFWYFKHRNLQNAADSAAMSAVAALLNIPNPDAAHKAQATSEAQATAARYGFVDTQGGVTVAVNIPPTSGTHTTDPNAVEVIISQPEALFLSSALNFGGTAMFSTKPTQTVRAVANPGTNGNGCVVTLDRSDVVDLSLNGNTSVNLTGCDLYINSDASNALNQVGNATVTARAAYIT